jgi:hypothetical protein
MPAMQNCSPPAVKNLNTKIFDVWSHMTACITEVMWSLGCVLIRSSRPIQKDQLHTLMANYYQVLTYKKMCYSVFKIFRFTICFKNIFCLTHQLDCWLHDKSFTDFVSTAQCSIYVSNMWYRGRDSSVGIVTVRGSNPGGGEIFRTPPDWPWGPPSLLYNGYRVFPGGKAARAWCWPPTPF